MATKKIPLTSQEKRALRDFALDTLACMRTQTPHEFADAVRSAAIHRGLLVEGRRQGEYVISPTVEPHVEL